MLMSRRKYAEHRGVSEGAVRTAIRQGRITTTNNKIDPLVADKQWDAHTNPAYHPPMGDSDNASRRTMSLRDKKDAIDVMTKSYHLDILKGKYILRELVEADTFEGARLVREKLLTIPDRVVPQIIGKTDVFEITEILRRDILECLHELTDFIHE